MNENLHMREEDLIESKSVGCSWEVLCMSSKEWYCWTGWHPCILKVTNLARTLEDMIRTTRKVGTNSTVLEIKKGVASLEEGVQGVSPLSKDHCTSLKLSKGNIVRFSPLKNRVHFLSEPLG